MFHMLCFIFANTNTVHTIKYKKKVKNKPYSFFETVLSYWLIIIVYKYTTFKKKCTICTYMIMYINN